MGRLHAQHRSIGPSGQGIGQHHAVNWDTFSPLTFVIQFCTGGSSCSQYDEAFARDGACVQALASFAPLLCRSACRFTLLGARSTTFSSTMLFKVCTIYSQESGILAQLWRRA